MTLIFCLLRSTLAACKEVGMAASWPSNNHESMQQLWPDLMGVLTAASLCSCRILCSLFLRCLGKGIKCIFCSLQPVPVSM